MARGPRGDQHRARARRLVARPGSRGVRDQVSNSRIGMLEEALRNVVSTRITHRLHQTPRVYLVNILKVGDSGTESGTKPSGKISEQSFQLLLARRLRFALAPEEVHAIFRIYGHDGLGFMPYELFCRRLFSGKSKMNAIQVRCPYHTATKSAGPRRALAWTGWGVTLSVLSG